mgnify:CR=1 FL=1
MSVSSSMDMFTIIDEIVSETSGSGSGAAVWIILIVVVLIVIFLGFVGTIVLFASFW